MAIYHLSAKTISRSAGRSATGAAAYRAGEIIEDARTGLVFDYGKKRGIDHKEIIVPVNAPDWMRDRVKLWNAVEHSEKRTDSQVAREVEVALPTELTLDQQRELVRNFVRTQFVDAGMVADIAIHHSDGKNPHAHILLTMRDIGSDGFGQKNRSWNDKAVLQNWRSAWELQTNLALARAGTTARIDHRTLKAQGIDREPTKHLGPAATGYERRTGLSSSKRLQQEQEASQRLWDAKKLGELERSRQQFASAIIDLSGDIETAKRDREAAVILEAKRAAEEGIAKFKARFEQTKQIEEGMQRARESFAKFKAEQARKDTALSPRKPEPINAPPPMRQGPKI